MNLIKCNPFGELEVASNFLKHILEAPWLVQNRAGKCMSVEVKSVRKLRKRF
jgi:hypothetical protein